MEPIEQASPIKEHEQHNSLHSGNSAVTSDTYYPEELESNVSACAKTTQPVEDLSAFEDQKNKEEQQEDSQTNMDQNATWYQQAAVPAGFTTQNSTNVTQTVPTSDPTTAHVDSSIAENIVDSVIADIEQQLGDIQYEWDVDQSAVQNIDYESYEDVSVPIVVDGTEFDRLMESLGIGQEPRASDTTVAAATAVSHNDYDYDYDYNYDDNNNNDNNNNVTTNKDNDGHYNNVNNESNNGTHSKDATDKSTDHNEDGERSLDHQTIDADERAEKEQQKEEADAVVSPRRRPAPSRKPPALSPTSSDVLPTQSVQEEEKEKEKESPEQEAEPEPESEVEVEAGTLESHPVDKEDDTSASREAPVAAKRKEPVIPPEKREKLARKPEERPAARPAIKVAPIVNQLLTATNLQHELDVNIRADVFREITRLGLEIRSVNDGFVAVPKLVHRDSGADSSLNLDEIEWVLQVLDTQIIHALGVARLYLCDKEGSGEGWKYSGLLGCLAIVTETNLQHRYSHAIKMVDLNGWNPISSVIFEQEFYTGMQYFEDAPFFHSFEIEGYVAGLSFASELEAGQFNKEVQQCLLKSPSDIADEYHSAREESFIHVGDDFIKKVLPDGINVQWSKPPPPQEVQEALGMKNLSYTDVEFSSTHPKVLNLLTDPQPLIPASVKTFAAGNDKIEDGTSFAWKKNTKSLTEDAKELSLTPREEKLKELEARKQRLKRLIDLRKNALNNEDNETARNLKIEIETLKRSIKTLEEQTGAKSSHPTHARRLSITRMFKS